MYTVKQINNFTNVSHDPKYWHKVGTNELGENLYLFRSSVAESWEWLDPSIKNVVQAPFAHYIRFLDTSPVESWKDSFKRTGKYCPYFPGSLDYEKYWDNAEQILSEGLWADGVYFTKRHVFYLNFSIILALDKDKKSTRKIKTFPRFLDHNYYFFLAFEELNLEGPFESHEKYFKAKRGLFNDLFFTTSKYEPTNEELQEEYDEILSTYPVSRQGIVVAKSRRKGFTYMVASGIYAYNYVFVADSVNILAAEETINYKVTLEGIKSTRTHINKNTPWVRRSKVLNKSTHFKASFYNRNESGVLVEDGFLSEIIAVSFKDSPFKTVGESAYVLGFEEAGKFQHLLNAYAISEPLIRDGEIVTGVSIIWGTGGDMDKGSIGLSKMFYQPSAYGFRPYENISEPQSGYLNTGWWIDDMWYLPGTLNTTHLKDIVDKETYDRYRKAYGAVIDIVDKQGNSIRRAAEYLIDQKRTTRAKMSIDSYNKFITQQPKYPSEAFLIVEGNRFDSKSAKEQLSYLVSNPKGEVVELLEGPKGIVINHNPGIKAVDEFPHSAEDTTGAWVLFDRPRYTEGYPGTRYIAGCDPIDFDKSELSGNKFSLGSVFILDKITGNIVAEYTARPKKASTFHKNVLLGVELYNALLLYERQLKGLFNYFLERNKAAFLADEPYILKDVLNRKVKPGVKGFSASQGVNEFNKDILNDYLSEQVPSDEDPSATVPRIFKVYSKPFLQELINYNDSGNFDRISSMGATILLYKTMVRKGIVENTQANNVIEFFKQKLNYGLPKTASLLTRETN